MAQTADPQGYKTRVVDEPLQALKEVREEAMRRMSERPSGPKAVAKPAVMKPLPAFRIERGD